MKFSMLLATLGTREKELIRLFDSLENQTYKKFELIVVSQGNHEKIKDMLNNYNFQYKHIPMDGKGISIARNTGLPYVDGDVLTFSDDDGWYKEDALDIVKKYFEKYEADMLTFKHIDPEKNEYTKVYPDKEIINLSKRDILKQMSLDIYINTNKVLEYKQGFDERFGVGTKYNSGEENIYLMDLYNKGYNKINFIPIIIAYHPKKECDYLDEKSFIGKGPLFKRLFGEKLGLPMILLFGLKKKKLIEQFEPGQFWKLYSEAIKECKKFKV